MHLTINPNRVNDPLYEDATGFYVRATNPETEGWGSYDIAQLDQESLRTWLKGLDPNGMIKIIMAVFDHPESSTTAAPETTEERA